MILLNTLTNSRRFFPSLWSSFFPFKLVDSLGFYIDTFTLSTFKSSFVSSFSMHTAFCTSTCLLSLPRPLVPCWPAVVRVTLILFSVVRGGVLILPPLVMMLTDVDVRWKPQVPSREGTASAAKANEGPALGSGKEAWKTPRLGSEGEGGPSQRDQVRQCIGEGPQSLWRALGWERVQGMRGNGGRPAREGVEEGKLDRPDSASIGDHSKGTALSQGQRVGRGTEQQQWDQLTGHCHFQGQRQRWLRMWMWAVGRSLGIKPFRG